MTVCTPAPTAVQTWSRTAAALVKSTSTSTSTASRASATDPYTRPALLVPVTADSSRPAADRDTPATRLRSSAASTAARIGGAVQPVTPAKQIRVTRRPYDRPRPLVAGVTA